MLKGKFSIAKLTKLQKYWGWNQLIIRNGGYEATEGKDMVAHRIQSLGLDGKRIKSIRFQLEDSGYTLTLVVYNENPIGEPITQLKFNHI